MPKLASNLEKLSLEQEPLWQGPSSDGPNGGITQSMLNQFLVCRERFRVRYVLGLQPVDQFNHRLEYGSMWHCCEQSLAAKDTDPWEKLDLYVSKLCERYPLQQADIIHWYNICKLQFPIYVDYWSKHPDVLNRKPLLQEEVFNVPYQLPSGRTVRLRGKFDSVDLIDGGIWLQENKTKGDIDAQLLQRQLSFDLQTGVYLTALTKSWPNGMFEKVAKLKYILGGVRYNVIRRPLGGGKGSIRQKKNQSQEEFYEELGNLIQGAAGPEWGVLPDEHYFFMRWKVAFTPKDIEAFRQQFLDPVLQQLCEWWDWICATKDKGLWGSLDGTPYNKIHWRAPYGIYSPLYDGKPTEMDEYLLNGSTVGLRRAESLFRELAE